MQAHCAEAFRDHFLVRLLGFRLSANRPLPLFSSSAARVSCSLPDSRLSQGWKQRAGRYDMVRAKKKDNVWSIDNEFASKKAAEEKRGLTQRRKMRKKVKGSSRSSGDSTVMVTRAMLTEIETVLQTQEPVIKPFWDIFASSLTGIWKGLGAVFSPITAEMEPIDVGNRNDNLFDCYNLSSIEKIPSEGSASQILRKTNWVAFNPFGESRKHAPASNRAARSVKSSISGELSSDAGDMEFDLPDYESFDFSLSESEEDLMSLEPGLVFFEDGSYSRGPVNIPIGEYDESKYFLSPTYMFEQCLVKGCHKRLRIVHTIEFNEGGANIQIIRVAVYEEGWVSPVNVSIGDGMPFDAKPISQRRRIQPSELVGSWKVFEVSATPVFSSVEEATLEGNPAFVYLCMETLKKRSLPESSAYFGEEVELDMNDATTVLWLPGGVAAYVDVNEEGSLCIGISWYSDEGLNLVMERDYGMDGNLKEVRWKSEIKRRWS